MSLHIMSAGKEGKSQIVNTDPAPGAVVIADDEIGLWVGGLITDTLLFLSLNSFVKDCMERLREAGTPTSTTGLYTFVGESWITGVPMKKDITLTVDATFGTPASNGIEIFIGDLFQPLPGTSVSTAIKRLLEARNEIHDKKAA